MIQIVTCAVKPKSENDVRRMEPMWRSGYVKGLRKKTAKVLALLQPAGAPPYVVTMTRISAGYLDDDGNVGAFKPVRDEIADWLRLNDRDPRVTWNCEQAACRMNEGGMSIQIEDGNVGEARRELRTADAPGDAAQLPPGTLTGQLRLPTFKAYLKLPWQQVEGEKPYYARAPQFDVDAPELLNVVVPVGAMRVGPWRPGEQVLFRRTFARKGSERIVVFKTQGG